jgi:hypothetical protein
MTLKTLLVVMRGSWKRTFCAKLSVKAAPAIIASEDAWLEIDEKMMLEAA